MAFNFLRNREVEISEAGEFNIGEGINVMNNVT